MQGSFVWCGGVVGGDRVGRWGREGGGRETAVKIHV